MKTTLLYIAVVLIWGSTWLAVGYQVGIVPPEASVAYRIGLASILMFTWTIFRRLPLRFSLKEHLFMALQGALIFSTNFFLFYHAAAYLTTGLIAVIFSTASAMTMLINAVLTKQLPASKAALGAIMGIVGIGTIFYEEFLNFSMESGALLGVLLSIGGTLAFSFGSIVSASNRRKGFSVCGNSSWAMLYGSILLTLFLFFSGHSFAFDPHPPYVISLLYLSIVGSIFAFAAYFALLGRIEIEQAAYATVLFPIVALSLSTLFEGYQWTASAFAGVIFILMGNIMVNKRSKKN